jgi:hypothetical protein
MMRFGRKLSRAIVRTANFENSANAAEVGSGAGVHDPFEVAKAEADATLDRRDLLLRCVRLRLSLPAGAIPASAKGARALPMNFDGRILPVILSECSVSMFC